MHCRRASDECSTKSWATASSGEWLQRKGLSDFRFVSQVCDMVMGKLRDISTGMDCQQREVEQRGTQV